MRKGIGGHQSTRAGSVSWLTPPEILRALGEFDYDPCPCLPQPWPTAFRVEHGDGLTADWHGRVFLNPPYGSELGAWLSRLADHGDGIAVAFARTETRAFFEHVWPWASGLLFLRGRVHFHRPDGARARGNAGGPTVLVAYGQRNAEILRSCGLAGAFVGGVQVVHAAGGADLFSEGV